ncbi:hypothetical protein KM043_008125 [Ampulex compressa]|nr:hypothetical protein KM043_008125 [Ampulex compressa]
MSNLSPILSRPSPSSRCPMERGTKARRKIPGEEYETVRRQLLGKFSRKRHDKAVNFHPQYRLSPERKESKHGKDSADEEGALWEEERCRRRDRERDRERDSGKESPSERRRHLLRL